jgi:predicted Rossmann-fold nucleotide-binding protein
MTAMDYVEIETASELAGRRSLDGCVLQGLDLEQAGIDWTAVEVTRRTFLLGCRLAPGDEAELRRRGAMLFPRFGELPYDTYRGRLYTSADLMQGYDGADFETSACDQAIYRNFLATRSRDSIVDELAQRLHDHSLTDALSDQLEDCGSKFTRGVVGIMGGHQSPRDSAAYRDVALLAHRLARRGFLVLTGGGPGAMEAGNLGAFLAPHDESAIDEALALLRPHASAGPPVPEGYLRSAQEVIRRYAPGVAANWGFRTKGCGPAEEGAGFSLAIPTWTYGHEPSNLFSSHVAKLFQNSVREEGLVTLAGAGLVFAPGKAGTCQEAFTDAVQNYYAQDAAGMAPMAFFPRAYWTETIPVVPCLHALAAAGNRPFARRVAAFDHVEEIVDFLLEPPAVD